MKLREKDEKKEEKEEQIRAKRKTTSDEGFEDEEEAESPAPTRSPMFILATGSYVVAVCSL